MYDLLIVVPYRDRLEHLKQFVPHMAAFLAGKQTFKLLIVQQTAGALFNRAKLINCGYRLGADVSQHLVIHDVDMLPADDRCDYTPRTWPTHLAGCASQYGYRRPYVDYIGGVFMISTIHFAQCNGMSNEFWGWGREDDEFADRLRRTSLSWDRLDGRYECLDHDKGRHNNANQQRIYDCWGGKYTRDDDGLSTLKYDLIQRESLRSFLQTPVPTHHEVCTVDLLYQSTAT